MKKKYLIIIIISILLILTLIGIGIILNNSNSLNKSFNKIEFSNIKINDKNITINYENKSKKEINLGKISIHLLNKNHKEILIIPIELNNIKKQEKNKLELIIEDNIIDPIDDFYVSEHQELLKFEENNDISNQDNNLESKLSNILIDNAKEIINTFEEKFTNTFIITAYEMKHMYNKDLKEFENVDYKCSLNNSYVEINLINNEYSYTGYVDCEIFFKGSEGQ